MKKILVVICSLVVILSGCQEQTAYASLAKDLDGLSKQDAFEVETSYTDTDDVSSYSFDLDSQVAYILFEEEDQEAYYTPEAIYSHELSRDKWFVINHGISEIPGMSNIKLENNPFAGLPSANTQISSEFTGVEEIDSVLQSAPLGELVVSPEEHHYSFVGLEDIFKIDLSDGAVITINFPNEDYSETIKFTVIDSVELPEIPEDAIDLTGAIDTIASGIRS